MMIGIGFARAVVRSLALFLGICLAVPPVAADPIVSVILHEGMTRVSVDPGGGRRDVGGRDALPLTFEPATPGGWVRVQGRPYRGTIEVRRHAGRLRVINHVGLEDYLRGVVPSEMPASWPLEALKAQAVAARTYALYRMQRAADDGVVGVLSATVLDQVYRGARAETGPSDAAIEATRGEAMALGDRWLVAYFHSACGGISDRPSAVWGMTEERRRDRGWIAADSSVFAERLDDGCVRSPWNAWRWTPTRAFLASKLKRITGFSRVERVEVASRTASGRVARFRVVGLSGRRRVERSVSGQAFRMAVGPDRLRSLLCEVDASGDRIAFRGSGWGHGVGLCQWGARGRAERGEDYRAILSAYYPGSWLARIAETR